jgi:hypothetical protein
LVHRKFDGDVMSSNWRTTKFMMSFRRLGNAGTPVVAFAHHCCVSRNPWLIRL